MDYYRPEKSHIMQGLGTALEYQLSIVAYSYHDT